MSTTIPPGLVRRWRTWNRPAPPRHVDARASRSWLAQGEVEGLDERVSAARPERSEGLGMGER